MHDVRICNVDLIVHCKQPARMCLFNNNSNDKNGHSCSVKITSVMQSWKLGISVAGGSQVP